MKEKSRIAEIMTQYTFFGEPEIQNVPEVVYKLEKREQMAVKSYFTRRENNKWKQWKQEPRKRKSRRVIAKK